MRPVLLDMTRAVGRRIVGNTPSGIDRVCDSYAVRFAGSALAVLQVRGHAIVLNGSASNALFAFLDAPTARFRREFFSLLVKMPLSLAKPSLVRGAVYINVGHSDFDLKAHQRFIEKHALQPVYLLHDLIPLTHPHVTTPHKTNRHYGRVMHAARSAAAIIVTTHVSANAMQNFADGQGLELPRLVVAPIAGASFSVGRPACPPSSKRHGHGQTDNASAKFVCVGTIETRKNHRLLLQVWSRLIDRLGVGVGDGPGDGLGDETPQLIFAGGWGQGAERIRSALRQDPRLNSHIEIRDCQSDPEIAQLLVGARGALLPTLAEGFGLPMVEALQMRLPVIASNLPVFEEVGQGIPTLLDPADVDGWADAILDFCCKGPKWQRQIAAMPGFRAPIWTDHFAVLDDCLENLAGLGARYPLDHARCLSNSMKRPERELPC